MYLSDEEAEALKHASAVSGKSQSELIREGVRRVTRGRRHKRAFHSMGIGEGPGLPIGQMAEEILEREWAGDLDADR